MMNTKSRTNHAMLALVAAGAALALSACGPAAPANNSPNRGTNQSSNQGSASPAWILASMPEDARPVGEIKASAVEGDTVAIRGRIGGRLEPISAESAVFTIVDPAVPSCADMDEDHCDTPWDYCCEPQENLNANNATIQLVDAAGRIMADTNPIAAGLDPLDEIVVVGTVGPRDNPTVLTIRATGVYIVAN
ncbi:MAG: hypothetical protein KDA05_09170 [Phycisphaerales bacterium]|nr:hypothetical protein [Phycisphaerales bacterium]